LINQKALYCGSREGFFVDLTPHPRPSPPGEGGKNGLSPVLLYQGRRNRCAA